MNYYEVRIGITPFSEEVSEIVIAQLCDIPFESFINEEGVLKCYIKESDFNSEVIEIALSELNKPGFELIVSARLIENSNWNILWESNFEPIIIDERCVIKASFHQGIPNAKYNIIIDPKMAFGTGHHQTTRLMIESMLDISFDGKRVMDMGCGTGILAILAAKMGSSYPIYAVDIDDIAIDSVRENACVNGVLDKIVAIEGDSSKLNDKVFDIILANINRNIILSDIERYSASLVPAGCLLLSGFYSEDALMIETEGAKYGLNTIFKRSIDNWTVIKMVKK